MSRTALEPKSDPKEITLNLRIDRALKLDFIAATKAEAKPATEVVRRLMREYVAQARRRAFLAEAERQSRLISSSAVGQAEEAEAMRWVDNVSAALPSEPKEGSENEWFHLPDKQRSER